MMFWCLSDMFTKLHQKMYIASKEKKKKRQLIPNQTWLLMQPYFLSGMQNTVCKKKN